MTISHILEPFAVSEQVIRRVFDRALSRGGDFCDLYFQRSESCSLGLEDGAVNRAASGADLGVGIRVVQGVETGYAYSESLDFASMLEAATVAATVASSGPMAAPTAFRVTEPASYYPIAVQWSDVSTKRRVDLMMDFASRIESLDPRIIKVSVSLRDSQKELVIIDSLGRIRRDFQPMSVLRGSCVAEQDGQRESNYVGLGARVGLEFYTEDRLSTAAKDLVSRTTILFDAVEGPAGEYPVVLGPGSSGILLHEAIGHGMEADAARSKRTIYADQVGQRIAPKNVTIVDDGTNANLRGSINTDDEGEDSQRTVLVENGILRTFMHDRISAQHFGVEPTGNGRRQSFRHIPLPRMRNTYLLGGHTPRDEIVASVEFGIFADHFTNGQVNIGQGDFTFYIKNGWLIEGGKLTRPIKDVNIIGNGPDVLRGVTMVGDDFELDTGTWVCGKRGQSVPVGLGMPTVKVGALTVGGRGSA
ncbi:MAG: metallopeptidase TldD-related protein [Myxococcota bacterium]|nr:metallopeptidase TldD-related protein [Myxococcota bacterium]